MIIIEAALKILGHDTNIGKDITVFANNGQEALNMVEK